MREADRLVLVGAFGAPQGVRGEIRVRSFTGEAEAIGAYGALTDATRSRAFAFERRRPLKDDLLVVKVKGVDTREAAAALTGVEIFARRDRLPPPKADEFYCDDLVGLEAVTRVGERLGRVASLMNYGAGDILEIASEGGGEALLLPFTKAVAPVVDFEAGRIVIEAPREVEGEADAP
ncbi:MAG TPA: ribosome maturation factor RimM [Roseiarcus sp.]|nr:ribosome maturation factor RimM [Roseiarcus sp.]